jgi:hypothetical protein
MAGEIEAAAAAATLQLQQMKLDYEASPDRQLERDEAALATMRSDPHHLNLALTSENARNQEALLEAKIRDAKAATPAVRTDAERLGEILSGKAEVPLIETTVDGQLTTHATMIAVDDLRSLGLTDAAVTAALNGGRETRASIADAKWIYEELMGDEMWVAKLAAGNREARKQLTLLNIVMNSQPVD